jgi:mRNA interferase RelE/StbE
MNEMITISKAEYNRLCEAAEDLADLQSYDRVMAAIESGEEELIPGEYVKRLLSGESALKVYREFRGLTQADLAEKAGINRVTVSEIEIGRKQGSVGTLNKLAIALNVAVDDLIS